MKITIPQLNIIMPLNRGKSALYCRYLNDAMEEYEIDTFQRIAAFLANVCVESGHLLYTCELASGRAYNDRADLGNTKEEAITIAGRHGKQPGEFYRGHGLIQITGYDNHKACGEALELDLLDHPILLMMPEHAAMSAAWFWHENKINRYADLGDFDGCCDKVNRGRKTVKVGDSNGWPERLAAYQRAMEVLSA